MDQFDPNQRWLLTFRDLSTHQSCQLLVPVHPGGLRQFSSISGRARRGGEADAVALPRCSGFLLPVSLLGHVIKMLGVVRLLVKILTVLLAEIDHLDLSLGNCLVGNAGGGF